jgi:Tfp pilus assembly protein PilO
VSEGRVSAPRTVLVVLLATLAITSCQRKAADDQSAKIASLEAENKDLRARLEQSQRQTEPARQEPIRDQPAAAVRLPAPTASLPAKNDYIVVIERLRKSLDEAHAANGELDARLAALDAQIASLQAERQKAAAIESENLEKLSIARHEIEAAQKDSLAKDARIAQLEVQARQLRVESGANAKQAAQLTQVAADLQDIFRRRETYISNILSRYKEITEQYRVVALDHSTDVARIQQALSMAEEDMRQLNSLNARALLIQKKLNK